MIYRKHDDADADDGGDDDDDVFFGCCWFCLSQVSHFIPFPFSVVLFVSSIMEMAQNIFNA